MNARQLKSSILRQAVSGKLVPQNPTDEPAAALLKRIRAEKERLIAGGKIKRDKNESKICRRGNSFYETSGGKERCIDDEIPFEIPESWEWCRVGDLFTNMTGLSYKKESLNKKSEHMIRVLRGGNIDDEKYSLKNDDVLISAEFVKTDLLLKKGYMITPAVSSIDHIGKIALIDKDYDDVVAGGFVLILKPVFNDDIVSKYLLYAFATKNHRDNCRNITHKSGQAFYNLSREKMMNLRVPLPPLAEQRRIVEKLETVLPLVKKYEEAEKLLDETDADFPERLKKSVLHLAVQGKLVPQNPADEPAAALLKKIRAEKNRLVGSGKLKRDKADSVIRRSGNSFFETTEKTERCIDEELPFEIPESWEWCRLSGLTDVIFDIDHKMPKSVANGIHFLSAKDLLDDGTINYDKSVKFISEQDYEVLSRKGAPQKGDIIYSRIGSIGRARIVDRDIKFLVSYSCCTIRPLGVDTKYLQMVMDGDFVLQQARKKTQSTGVPDLGMQMIKNFLIPIPPLAEQKRIVEKIEELLPLIENLQRK